MTILRFIGDCTLDIIEVVIYSCWFGLLMLIGIILIPFIITWLAVLTPLAIGWKACNRTLTITQAYQRANRFCNYIATGVDAD